MTIVHLSYAQINEYHDPNAWLKKLSFYTGILEAMTKYGDIRSVHCISYSGVLCENDVEYHFLKRKKWQLWFPFGLHTYLKKMSPNAIVVHGLIFPWQVILLKWQLGNRVKIIAQHHAEKPFRDIRRFLQQWADRYIDAYLFCSVEQGNQWVDNNLIENPEKVKEIMGTSSTFHAMDKGSAKAVTKVEGDTNFLWVGRLDNNKDPLTVVRAFMRFVKNNSSVRLFMVYQTFQLLDEVKAIIASNPEVSNHIQLLGKVENMDLLYWYNSADFIISSSHYEGSGVAVCEGLSCGCIPILTNIPSFRMMTDNGRIGLLFEPGNEEALLHALNQSVQINRVKMKQLVLQQFDRKLSFEANARNIVDVIHSI